MKRSTFLQTSLITLAAAAGIVHADEAATAPMAPTPDVYDYRPFTGAEEPRPGNFLVERRLTAGRMERAAFLGISANAIDAALRTQLDLPKGVGLVVGLVEKGSPADQAGLQQHDILQKLNDQLLINSPQLSTLVRTFKAGDEVTLSVIRKGKPVELKAKLIERDMPPLADAGDPFTINFAREPANFDRTRTLRAAPEAQRAIEQLRLQLSQDGDKSPRIIRVSPDSTRIVSRDDGTHSIQLTERGGSKTLSVRDTGGKVLFEGPYNTPEEQEKAPAEIREKVKKIEEGVEFKPATPTTNPSEPKASMDRKIIEILESPERGAFFGGC